MIVLLTLKDDGTSAYNHQMATSLAQLQVPSFACTPDRFPDLIGAAVRKQDLGAWVSQSS